MADIPSRKPILTIEQQIEHLRRKAPVKGGGENCVMRAD